MESCFYLIKCVKFNVYLYKNLRYIWKFIYLNLWYFVEKLFLLSIGDVKYNIFLVSNNKLLYGINLLNNVKGWF